MEKYRTIWITLLQWGLLWTVVIGCSLAWNRHLVTEHITKHAREEAVTVINKDLAFRRWATMHGGVYVPPTEKPPPNQWLSVPKRDVVTTDGDRLTLMNPAYMTRQVMELFGDQYGIKGHITSLIAKNPVNAPDPWERDALIRLEKGEKTVGTLADIEGEPYYRLILPMRMEQGCLKCHADTKIPVGGLRGGISAAVPMTPHHQAAVTSMRGVNLDHGAIWLVGMLGITTVSLYKHRQQQREWKAEEELRAQEALYASLTTASPAGVFQTDLHGSCCYVNDRWSAITGLPMEAALGNGWTAVLHPDDRQRVCDAWQQLVAGTASFNLEYRFTQPDGRTVWVLGQAARIVGNNGTVSGYVGTITEISRLKQVEAQLAENAMFLNESQAIARLAGWKSNPHTDLLEWTDAMYQILEHPADQPLSHEGCFHYFDPQDLPQVQQALEQAFTTGEPFRLNCRMISATGRRFWADFRCIGRLEGTGEPHIAGTLQDITEYKQVEELLTSAKQTAEATSRAKSELLATLSHELRTPLNGVMGGAQLLEMTELNDEQAEYLQMIRTSASNELSLVNDLLDLAGLEAAGVKLVEEPFSVPDSINLAVTLHRAALEERGLVLTVDLADSLQQRVKGDPRRLTQIIANLLSNAVKFTGQGEISIRGDAAPDQSGRLRLRLMVCDTGIGIAPQDQERIFEPFVQADMSNTRQYGGTGLGLSISRKLAQRMGGVLLVSSSPGQGSCFTLELPLQPVENDAVPPADAQDSPLPVWEGPHLKIVVAEDNETNLKTAAGLLTRLGLTTLCAGDGKQAVAYWLGGGVDLIMMDIQMPVMDGHEALRFIRQREQGSDDHLPVIAVTAHAMLGDRERLLAEGFDGYVAKPFQLQELLAELQRVMAGRTRA
ncbi:MAG: DUF3365 domain-containing protein [Geobacter sp.]|nr:DUF3365 domain-containing protein [Geobacter sp.]